MLRLNLADRRAFTIIEVFISVLIACLIFFAVWSVYATGWTWYYEVAPKVEAQRIARLAVVRIIEGTPDSTTGQDAIGASNYKRKNGILSTFYALPVLAGAVAGANGIPESTEINFGLFQDYGTYQPDAARNVRAYYLGTDANSGLKAVYYKDGSGNIHRIDSTLGITDLKFRQPYGAAAPDIISVTATVEKDIHPIGGATPYHVKVEYTDYAYLKNVQL